MRCRREGSWLWRTDSVQVDEQEDHTRFKALSGRRVVHFGGKGSGVDGGGAGYAEEVAVAHM
jgi:hypothetical protein